MLPIPIRHRVPRNATAQVPDAWPRGGFVVVKKTRNSPGQLRDVSALGLARGAWASRPAGKGLCVCRGVGTAVCRKALATARCCWPAASQGASGIQRLPRGPSVELGEGRVGSGRSSKDWWPAGLGEGVHPSLGPGWPSGHVGFSPVSGRGHMSRAGVGRCHLGSSVEASPGGAVPAPAGLGWGTWTSRARPRPRRNHKDGSTHRPSGRAPCQTALGTSLSWTRRVGRMSPGGGTGWGLWVTPRHQALQVPEISSNDIPEWPRLALARARLAWSREAICGPGLGGTFAGGTRPGRPHVWGQEDAGQSAVSLQHVGLRASGQRHAVPPPPMGLATSRLCHRRPHCAPGHSRAEGTTVYPTLTKGPAERLRTPPHGRGRASAVLGDDLEDTHQVQARPGSGEGSRLHSQRAPASAWAGLEWARQGRRAGEWAQNLLPAGTRRG